MSFTKWLLFCSGLNVSIHWSLGKNSHYLSHWFLFIKWSFRKKLQWSSNQSVIIFFQNKFIGNVIHKVVAVLFRPECFNSLIPGKKILIIFLLKKNSDNLKTFHNIQLVSPEQHGNTNHWQVKFIVHVNSSPPSAAYMHQWIGSALVQIMACRLFGAKPLSNPMLGYCQLDRQDQISVKF